MGFAERDQNRVTTLLAVSKTDGVTPVALWADPITHRLLIDNANSGASIGGSISGGTQGSVLFIGGASALSQDNNNLYFQDNATTPSTLATNMLTALSVDTNGDFTGTDSINTYAQVDAFLFNSQITNNSTGLATDGATPGFTASSSRGSLGSMAQLQAGDLTGGFSGWGAQGASSPAYQNLGGMFITTAGASTNNLGGELDFYTKTDGGSLVQNMVLTNAGFLGIGSGLTGSNTTSLLTADVENLGATLPVASQGILLQNLTAAIAGTTQNSPGLFLSSNGWGTTAPSSQNVSWRVSSTPVQSTVPTGNFIIGSSVAGAAYGNRLTLSTAGLLTITSITGTTALSFTGISAIFTLTRTALAGVSTDGMVATNTTASTSGAPIQWSPRIRLSGTAWNTGGTPATNTDDFIVENQTVSGNPTSAKLVISSQLNAAGYTPVFTINSNGTSTAAATITAPNTILTANAIAAAANAATVPITSGRNIITNNSAATLTITMTTASAVNMQTCIVQILDFSAVAQTITWVNTENSIVTAPATSNGSTTLPLTVGLIFNSSTSKWRIVAVA